MTRYATAPYYVSKYLRPSNTRYGASFFRKPRESLYKRRFESLHHYPVYSSRKKWTLNWLYDKPLSGYEGVQQFGPHTLQLTGLPHGVANQFIEERLRRFFSEFGTVLRCHSVPHFRDSFQSSGVGYVSFESKISAEKAAKAHIKLGNDFTGRVLHITNLGTDTKQDRHWYQRELHACQEVTSIARQLYLLLDKYPRGIPVTDVSKYIMEKRFGGGALKSSGSSVYCVYGSWLEFFDSQSMQKMFIISGLHHKNTLKLPTVSPSAAADRVCNAIAGMIHRGEWMEQWNKKSPVIWPEMVPRSEMNSDTHRLVEILYDGDTKTPSCFYEKQSLHQLKLGEEIEQGMMPQHAYESALVKSVMIEKNTTNGDTVPSIEQFTEKDENYVRLAVERAASTKIIVSKRTLTPEMVESTLRDLYSAARTLCECKRASSWMQSTQQLPVNVKKTMQHFFSKPALPQKIQIQSRPESVYRRIYDERHLLSLELERKQQKEKEKLKQEERKLANAVEQQEKYKEVKLKQARLLNLVGLSKK